MFRPTGFADLAGKRVGIFGVGVEGRASAARLAGVAGSLVLVDDADDRGPDVLVSDRGGHEVLLECDAVLKSPGIARRRADVVDLESHGVIVTSALNLWLHDVDRGRVVAITGTKGKSTTTALVTFFLRCLGEDAQSLGNIGRPPYDPSIDTSSGWLVLEVSSFQCLDIEVAPALVVVTSLGADHLDWHGSLDQYVDDKLSLTRAAGDHRTLVPDSSTFHDVFVQLGGEVSFVDPASHGLASQLGLLGAHSESNVALALAVTAILVDRDVEEIRAIVEDTASSFVPLKGRLTLVASETRDGNVVRYVDDGLATAPLPTIAALDVFRHVPVVLLAGGFDRGVDYSSLAQELANRTPQTHVITMGDAGTRLGASVRDRAPTLSQSHVDSMDDAVGQARDLLKDGGVVLLSPAAPSFDRYRNWEERSDDFTRVVRAVTSAQATTPWSLGGDSNS